MPECRNCGYMIDEEDWEQATECPRCGANPHLIELTEEDLDEDPLSSETDSGRREDYYRWAAQRALDRRQYSRAEHYFEELLELTAEDWEVGRRLAMLQEEQGAFQRALSTWEELIRIHDSSEARARYTECVLQIAEMQESRHAFDEAIETCRRGIVVVGESAQSERLHRQIEQIRNAEIDYEAEEREVAEARRQRAGTASVAGGFGAVTGALTMIAGVLLIMLSLAMVPCCIGIFLLPVAFSVFVTGVGMLAGAPAGGAAVYTLGELPHAMKRFGEYWHGLTPQARRRASVGIAIAVAAIIVLGLIGTFVGGATEAGT